MSRKKSVIQKQKLKKWIGKVELRNKHTMGKMVNDENELMVTNNALKVV